MKNSPNTKTGAQIMPYTLRNTDPRFSRCDSGMTRTQLLVLIGLVVLIIALSLPPYLEYNWKVLSADNDVDTIAVAVNKYHKHTTHYPQKLEDLVTDPGLEGWQGSYLDEIPETPWGGSYQMLPDSYKVCISENHPRVPEKYKLGGVAEISRVYLEGEDGAKYWWN